ncbi:hypothetical protein KI387_029360, partial [Taxus chinensis]
GIAVNTYTMEQSWYPLVYGGDVANVSGGYTSYVSSGCALNSLDRTKVKGKIVLCYYVSDPPDYTVFLAGGAGTIIMLDGYGDTAFPWLNPATVISTEQGKIVMSYINSTRSAVARIEKTTTPKALAPIVALFSSRGYNPITMDILKPDITAPGVDILASWAKNSSITGYPEDTRHPDFNIISGTSMSCPHASGAAGFVKSYHHDWSPAAIRSSLMTTAFTMDATLAGNEDAEFGYGAGQINPVKAVNPGLVYDAGVDDYIKFLCSQGYNDTTLRLVTGDRSSCGSVEPSKTGARELNYPSIMVVTIPGQPIQATFPRTVTNVGEAVSTYKVVVHAPSKMNVTVEPDTLSFSSLNQKLSYNVTIKGGPVLRDILLSGALTWNYGNYSVRSPINVYGLRF